jgi:hypothetical protein
MLVVLVYFIRGTVLPWYVHVPDSAWILLIVAALFAGAGMAVAGGGTWRLSWVIVLLAFAASLTQAEQFKVAGSRWVGLALMILAVGPVIVNPGAVEARAAAWRLMVTGMTTLTAIFVMWYVLRLPSFGAGDFSSFMNQCMLVAPISGIGVVIALARALHGRSWRWGVLAVAGLVPMVAAGSRVAVLATGAAVCFLLVRRKPALGGVFALLFLCLIGGFFLHHGTDDGSDESAGGLVRKGTVNTRADLWQSRMEEFESSPVLGIGVAMGTGSGSAVEQGGAIRVEPGSSYLAILAMTGALGTLSFGIALGLLLYGFASARQQPSLDRDILSVVGVFLAVHGIAEGWVLAFGSPLACIFWLWLGNVGDAALQPARAIAKRRVSAPPRFARPIGPTPTAPSC